MKLYLLHSDGTYDNAADYPENPPFPAPEGAQWVEGEPEGLAAKQDKSPLELISEQFSALPKASRKKLRKFITEGYPALVVGNAVSIQDVLEEAVAAASTAEETEFLQNVQSLLS